MAAKKVTGWTCHDCGVKYGSWYQDSIYVGPKPRAATYHIGKCDYCGATGVPCTEPRDYGNFSKLIYDGKTVVDLVEVVMNNFDFEKVHRTMNLLDWKWAHLGEGLRVPSLSRIMETARGLLNQVALAAIANPGEEQLRATGGFWATADDSGLWLKFVVVEWDEFLEAKND